MFYFSKHVPGLNQLISGDQGIIAGILSVIEMASSIATVEEITRLTLDIKKDNGEIWRIDCSDAGSKPLSIILIIQNLIGSCIFVSPCAPVPFLKA